MISAVLNKLLTILKSMLRSIIAIKDLSIKTIIKRTLITLSVCIALIIVASVSFFYAVKAGFFGEIPNKETLQDIQNYEASEVYSSDGVLLGKFFLENRTNIKFDDLSPHIINALIATEDARFYEHKGVDRRSMLRVIFKSILLGDKSAGGGSTISQQLIKNLYGRKNHGALTMPVNKIKEAIIAQLLEECYSKNDILELYLNTVSFGEDTYGIGAACLRFYNTTPDAISIEQAAVLIGLLKAPTTYNPRINPEKSKTRRNIVLNQLFKYEYIDKETLEINVKKEIVLNYTHITKNSGIATYFREHIRKELENWSKTTKNEDGEPYNIYTDGLKIHTTINSKMQTYAEEAVLEHLGTLQPLFKKHIRRSKILRSSSKVLLSNLKKTPDYKELKAQNLSDKEIIAKLKTVKQIELYTPKEYITIEGSALDSLRHYMAFLHAGFLAINPGNGEVLAWVGGLNHKIFEYDHVLSKRQVGSTFKPFVYANALEHGMKPCKYIKNNREIYEEYDNWSPRNADGNYEGFYTMKGGLTNSVNTISVKVLLEAGLEETLIFARKMGIDSKLPDGPSVALGTANLSLLELLGAYTSFANEGVKVKPQLIKEVKNKKGKVIYRKKGNEEKVLSKKNAHLMANMLQSVVKNGTGRRLASTYNIRDQIGGKTGTTQSYADGWFIGFNPSLLAGVWVGADDQRLHFSSGKLGQGANMALPIWAKFWNKMKKDDEFSSLTKTPFPRMSSREKEICDCELYADKRPGLFNRLFGKKHHDHDDDEHIESMTELSHRRANTPPKKYVPRKKTKKKKFRLFKSR